MRRSGDGTTYGWTRNSGPGTLNPTLTASAALYSPSRANKTNTDPSSKFAASSAGPPRRKRVFSPTAAIRRTKRSEEHTSELQSLMRNSYAVFCLKKKKKQKQAKK